MKRNLIVLNLVLAAAAGWFGWSSWNRWKTGDAKAKAAAKATVKPPVVLAPQAAPDPKPIEAAEYIDVSARMLYAKDRNSNVVAEAPPPPPPPPPMPPFPVYLGQMSFTEPVIIFATDKVARKTYTAGQEVGGFKLVSFDRDNVTFEWNEKTVERKLADLKPKEPLQTPQQIAAAAPSSSPTVQSLSPVTSMTAPQEPGKPQLGDVFGDGRACVSGDNSPAGTVLNGYRKVISRGLMGQTCYWEPVK